MALSCRRIQRDVRLCLESQFSMTWNGIRELMICSQVWDLLACQSWDSFFPYHMLNKITQGIFNIVLIYCLPFYGGLDKGQLSSVKVLQNNAVKIVKRSPQRSVKNTMYDKLDWLTLNQLVTYHTLIQVYKIRTSGEPEYLSSAMKN